MLNFSKILIPFKSKRFTTNINLSRYFSQILKETTNNSSRTQVQELLISTAVSDGKVPSSIEWAGLRNSVFEHGNVVNRVNFDAKTIGWCINHRNYPAAKAYMKYIEEQNDKPNIATIGKFMLLYYVCNEGNGDISSEEESNILSMYKKLKNEHQVLASITKENLIHALSLTKEWRECLKLLDKIKILHNPSASTYNVIIKAAFLNNYCELAWKLMNEMISKERLPDPSIYLTWLNVIQENSDNFRVDMNKLFQFFIDNDIQPTRTVTDSILNSFRPLSYTGIYTQMSNRGHCHSCNKLLHEIRINDSDFEELKTAFMNNVIIGKNVFNKTTPGELERFKCFVEEMKPWDIVIDGLNIAFATGHKQSEDYAKLLASVVTHFRQMSKSVLILGREHMNKWPKHFMNYVRANAHIFLTQNLSQDDPFLLYATMSSGLGTCFLSRDLMRGHLYLLMDPKLKRLFRRWQQLHQYNFSHVSKDGKIHIQFPFPIVPTIQVHDSGWHIPYVENFSASPPSAAEPPQNWLCLRKINSF